MADEKRPVIDFEASSEGTKWSTVNDGVMGGISSSSFVVREARGIFSGFVSLENKGGFASVWRRICTSRLKGASGIHLRVKGDGSVYRFRLKGNRCADGIIYQKQFKTRQGDWTEYWLPFAEFYPGLRGRRVDAPPLKPEEIQQIGFLIAEKQRGPFHLEIDWIRIGAESGGSP